MKKMPTAFVRWTGALVVTGCLLTVTSCKRNEEPLQPANIHWNTSGDMNKSLENVALVLAPLLEKAEVRALIKAEALKRFDGDYDILYRHIATLRLPNGESFQSALKTLHPSLPIGEIFGQVPNLQLSVPVHAEQWDTERFVPLVAANRWGVQEDSYTTLRSFDSRGKVHLLDSRKAPDFPVVVVGVSERVDERGNLKFGLDARARMGYEGNPIGDIFDDGGNSGPGSGGRTGSTVCRKDNDGEYMKGINCPDLGQFESWANGSPEFRLVIKSSKSAFGGQVYDAPLWAPHRSSVYEKNWWNPDTRMIKWSQAQFGEALLYFWYEEDGGAVEQEFKAQLSYTDKNTGVTTQVSSTIKIGNLDDKIGEIVIVQHDCPSRGYYNIGSNFNFKSLGITD
jgi:hypothetical protein